MPPDKSLRWSVSHKVLGRERAPLLALLLIASGGAVAGESAETLRAYVRDSSFTMTVPTGWKVTWKADSSQVVGGQRRDRVFEIVSAPSGAKGKTLTIYASFYRNMLPTKARQRWEGFSQRSTELAPMEGLSKRTHDEPTLGRTNALTAYKAVGSSMARDA